MKNPSADKSGLRDEWLLLLVETKFPSLAPQLRGLRAQGGDFTSDWVLRKGLLTIEELGFLIKEKYGIPFFDPTREDLSEMAVKLIPEGVCRRHMMIPSDLDDETLTILAANPLDALALSDARALTGREVVPVFAAPEAIRRLLEKVFHKVESDAELMEKLSEDAAFEVVQVGSASPPEEDDESAGPVGKLTNTIFVNAVKMRASDIHIEQHKGLTKIRFRIDGHLRSIMDLPASIGAGPLVARIKILGGMDISEHRRPLDGRARVRVEGAEIGLRISTLPTSLGEKVVVRILDKRQAEIPFASLGFRPEITSRLETALESREGMILVAGPTGSGKTTTLYACINRLKSDKTNIVSIEDPIEYKLEGINQVQVNEKAGLTFAETLRAVLRQDPDVILLGEMRDRETATIAFQAANTGHLVLSTLHSNDCVATISRLQQMGVDAERIVSGLNTVISQRLVRRICTRCRQPLPLENIPERWVKDFKTQAWEGKLFWGPGCVRCDQIGYFGRLAVSEFLDVGDDFRQSISKNVPETELRRVALEKKWLLPASYDLHWHISAGNTSLEEAGPMLAYGLKGHEAVAEVAAQAAATAPLPLAGQEILIVDDEPAILRLLRRLLESIGGQVREASDGKAGLEAIRQRMPDLLITDLHMPVMDGMRFIRALRAARSNAKLPIIILTSVAASDSQILALQSGADDYLIKPFNTELLGVRVEALLRRVRAMRQEDAH